MAKVADVKLSWVRSPSADVNKRRITVTKNGETTVTDLGAEVSEYVIEVHAMGVVTFKTEVFDNEGRSAVSETYTFTLGDLVPPQPDTGLFHDVVGVRDVP